jgi:hypothetical protein
MALLFCVVALAVGTGFDFARDASPRFGLAAQPGGRAVLGAVVAAFLVLIAHAMRWLLTTTRSVDSRTRLTSLCAGAAFRCPSVGTRWERSRRRNG